MGCKSSSERRICSFLFSAVSEFKMAAQLYRLRLTWALTGWTLIIKLREPRISTLLCKGEENQTNNRTSKTWKRSTFHFFHAVVRFVWTDAV